jgi:phosphate transport system protein
MLASPAQAREAMMIPHTDTEFEQELKLLSERLRNMAERAAAQIAAAMKALTDRDDDLAHEVIKGDVQLDRAEMGADELAMRILAVRHPVASDLRFTTMSLKFVTDVERIGDLACGIAKRVLELNRLAKFEPRAELGQLATLVQKNLHNAIDAFVRRDADLAAAVIASDLEIDRLNATLFAELIAHVAADPATVTRVLPLTSVCRCLERIGDHVKNLAEEVIFMVRATDVRHRALTASN